MGCKKNYPVSGRFGVVAGVAECEVCGWKTYSFKNVQALAKQHAQHYGHSVWVDVGMSGRYTPAGAGECSAPAGPQSTNALGETRD